MAPLSEIFQEEVLGKYIKKLEADTIHHGTNVSELQNLKTIMGGFEDVESRSPPTTAREGKMLVTGKLLAFGVELGLMS